MRVSEMSEDDARAVCSWRYEPPYDVYDHPDYELAAAQGWAITNAEARTRQFRTVWDQDTLVGFSRLFTRDGTWLLGVGMDPALTGQGRGHDFMTAVLADAANRHRGPLELEVRAFNERALRTYRRLGFRQTGQRVLNLPQGAVAVVVMTDDRDD